ncbi:hypothetical protein F511_42116 [Dorcoceras hygrometricum]|uniref:CCHC-type domain-containing protein n=1 Tax=Dorcoceras hygrometricum TaxID=472368 RepID=A0A2Z7BU41_9LAMI|nr:hypothetical protein F511_42116 [Dorcoceras hygrometricum]
MLYVGIEVADETQVLQLAVVSTQLVVPQEMPPRRRGRSRGLFQESGGQNEDQSSAPSHTLDGSREEEAAAPPAPVERMDVVAQAVQGVRPAGQGAQSSQSSQSAHFPQQQQQQVAQQSGRQRFRPRGQQFKKKSGSGSSGSGSSSSSGSRAEFCGFCGGKHSSTQCVGVQGSCNLCGQYGHFARVCPTAGAQQTMAQPQGRGACCWNLARAAASYDDVRSVCFRRLADVRITVERSFGESVNRFDDVCIFSRCVGYQIWLLPESSGFLSGLVVAQYKAPLEDFDGYSTSANTHPHKQHLYGLLDSTMHTSRNCVTNYIHKFNVIVLGRDLL